jgi:hypothetical protein
MLRLLLVLSLFSVACNDGGDPPPGEGVAIESTGWGFIEPCFGGDDVGVMLDGVEDVEAWMAPCGAPNVEKQNQIVNLMLGLDDSRRLVAARVTLGGCIQDWWLRDLTQDGSTIYIWILKEDTSFNVSGAACTDDIGWAEGYWIAAEGDVADTTAASLWLGTYNPDQAGAPDKPGG